MMETHGTSQSREGPTPLEAQQSALELASWLNSSAVNYALDLYKTWFELAQRQATKYASLPQRLAECRNPQEVFFLQADVIEKATQDVREGLSTQSSAIGRAAKGCKEGLDRFARVGEEMANTAGKTIEQMAQAAQPMMKQAGQAIEQGKQAAQRAARSEAQASRSGTESREREQAHH
jgi:methyl-accepting chemotaxis protein